MQLTVLSVDNFIDRRDVDPNNMTGTFMLYLGRFDGNRITYLVRVDGKFRYCPTNDVNNIVGITNTQYLKDSTCPTFVINTRYLRDVKHLCSAPSIDLEAVYKQAIGREIIQDLVLVDQHKSLIALAKDKENIYDLLFEELLCKQLKVFDSMTVNDDGFDLYIESVRCIKIEYKAGVLHIHFVSGPAVEPIVVNTPMMYNSVYADLPVTTLFNCVAPIIVGPPEKGPREYGIT